MTDGGQLKHVAEAIHRRGFAVPAIFFLEMYKPLVGCCREFLVMIEPIAIALVGKTGTGQLKEVLSSSSHIEELIQLLEFRQNLVSINTGSRVKGL